jgi:hypothetical protein
VSVGNAFDVVGSLLDLHASKNNGNIAKYLLGVLISARLSAAWLYLHRIVKSPGDDASRYSRDFKDSDLKYSDTSSYPARFSWKNEYITICSVP